MNILVTGGTGFIGVVLVKQLVEQGYTVRILTRKSIKNTRPEIEFIQCDLSRHDLAFEHMVSDCQVVINCAGELRDEAKMHDLHVTGTGRLLQAFKKSASIEGQVKHWVQLSSVGAYGPVTSPGIPRVVTEDTPLNPSGSYEITKTLADQMIMRQADAALTYTILRPSNVIGPAMPNQSFAGLIRLIKSGMFFYIGSRETISTYVHVDDVVAALVLCIRCPKALNQVFNLSNDCKLSEIVTHIARDQHKRLHVLCVPERMVRAISMVMTKIVKWPLSQSRIDALISKTHYPSTKIEGLGFKLAKPIPEFAVDYSHRLDTED